jgi:hypothetical protein
MKVEAKHVAGPWIAQANPDSIDIEGYKRIVAVVPGTDDEAIDISRLIAAAPDMYGKIKEVIDFIWREMQENPNKEDKDGSIMDRLIDRQTDLIATLRKIEGGQHENH